MKTLFISLFTLISINSFSQSPLFSYWDFQLDTVSLSQFSIDSTNQDNYIWQIGESHKPFFGNTNVLVTDTIQMYNGPIDASVNLLLTKTIGYGGFVIEFEHKMDTDTNHAGGYFEINIDNDSIQYINSNNDTLSTYWMKLIFNQELDSTEYFSFEGEIKLITENNDTITLYDMFFNDYYFILSLQTTYFLSYGYTDTLFNNINGFTGNFNDYRTFYLDFLFESGGVKTQDQRDSLNFRFHFVSDAASNNKNGWAIRNIKTGYSVHPAGSVPEHSMSNQINVFPNPTTDKFNVVLNTNKKENIIIDIYNLSGQKVESFVRNINKITIDLSVYPKGIYLVKYLVKENEIGYSKVVKL